MAESLVEQIMKKIKHATSLYHRLILVVAHSGEGKTSALQDVSKRIETPLININLELSRRMLDLTERQRALQVTRILSEIVDESEGEVALLDNIEILFEVALKQDPLRLLQGLSRNKTIVAAWNGNIDNNRIIYAIPGHPEYRHYPIRDFMVACPEGTA